MSGHQRNEPIRFWQLDASQVKMAAHKNVYWTILFDGWIVVTSSVGKWICWCGCQFYGFFIASHLLVKLFLCFNKTRQGTRQENHKRYLSSDMTSTKRKPFLSNKCFFLLSLETFQYVINIFVVKPENKRSSNNMKKKDF